jgi:hypothetical protein
MRSVSSRLAITTQPLWRHAHTSRVTDKLVTTLNHVYAYGGVEPNSLIVGELLFHVGAHSWLRHCATSRKVAGSIPDGVTGFFFFFFNPSSRNFGPCGRLSL